MSSNSTASLSFFQTLVEIVQKLRGPDGCPWDKEQSQKSLTQYAIEEAYELAEAIESGNQSDVQEELGDFLFQVILQAQVAEDEGLFDLAAVISSLNEKMIRRHPHVFGDDKFADSEAVWRNWDKVKNQEKAANPKKAGTLFSYPRHLPALQAAAKIGRKTETWRFDWQNPEQVLEKVREEFLELETALREFREKSTGLNSKLDKTELEHEIGDLLFSTAQLARHVQLDPEACLRIANGRFESRFQKVITKAGLAKEDFAKLSLEKKEQLWSEIKSEEK